MADAPLPLDGVRVVAVEQAIAAPLCTRHLADLGADVVKVERPGTGDFARHYDTTVNGLSSHFVWVNRGKRPVCLDLKSEEGAELFGRLVDRADVLVSNPGTGRDGPPWSRPRQGPCRAPRTGALQHLRLRHRRSLPGGACLRRPAAGRDRAAVDHRHPRGAVEGGIPVADIAAGMYAFSSILAALLRRASTGEGAFCDISLLESLAEWMGYPLHYTRDGGTQPPRSGGC